MVSMTAALKNIIIHVLGSTCDILSHYAMYGPRSENRCGRRYLFSTPRPEVFFVDVLILILAWIAGVALMLLYRKLRKRMK